MGDHPRPWYANALKDRDQLSCVAPLPWRDQHRQGTAAAVSGQMNLRGQASPGPAEALIGTVLSRPGTFPWNPRRTLSSPRGMLMGPAGRRISAHHAPINTVFSVGAGLDGAQDLLPSAVRRPTPMPVVAGLIFPEARRQVPPGDTGARG